MYTIDRVLPSYTAIFWATQIYFGGKQGCRYNGRKLIWRTELSSERIIWSWLQGNLKLFFCIFYKPCSLLPVNLYLPLINPPTYADNSLDIILLFLSIFIITKFILYGQKLVLYCYFNMPTINKAYLILSYEDLSQKKTNWKSVY